VAVNMFANACSGKLRPKEVAAEAQGRVQRYYKT
jgi:hypothetical protein